VHFQVDRSDRTILPEAVRARYRSKHNMKVNLNCARDVCSTQGEYLNLVTELGGVRCGMKRKVARYGPKLLRRFEFLDKIF
jgi:hypothetical protein